MKRLLITAALLVAVVGSAACETGGPTAITGSLGNSSVTPVQSQAREQVQTQNPATLQTPQHDQNREQVQQQTQAQAAQTPRSQQQTQTQTQTQNQTPIRQQDRDQIQRQIRDYFSALLQTRDQTRTQDQDREQLRQHVAQDVPNTALDQVRERARVQQYELVGIPDVQVSSDGTTATATVRMTVTRQMQLERVGNQWQISTPDPTQ